MLNLPINFDIEGKTDIEIPHPTSEFAHHFQNHDFEILKRQVNITSIDIYPYGKEVTLQPYACEKFPLCDSKKCCIGVIYHARKFTPYNLRNLLNVNLPCTYTCRRGTDDGGALDPDDIFTEREMEIIFLTIHALSAKRLHGYLIFPIARWKIGCGLFTKKLASIPHHNLSNFAGKRSYIATYHPACLGWEVT